MSEKALRLAAAALAIALAGAGAAHGAGSAPAPTPQVVQSPEEQAVEHYNQGLKYRNKAGELEQKAAAAAGEQQQKYHRKAESAYKDAVREFRSATMKNPRLHQAFSELGYAYRKTGQFEEALSAYDRALHLQPNYGPALEYRGEAYLGLNRIDDAKGAYMALFNGDRALAAQLLAAMEAWVERRHQDPAGVAADALVAFETWVHERKEIAEQTAALLGEAAAARAW